MSTHTNILLERIEWEKGAEGARRGLSLSQSSKYIDRYDHDLRAAHKAGWQAMRDYITLKEIDERITKYGVSH